MKTKISKCLLSFFSLLLIASCGLKGPLYQTPDKPAPAQPAKAETTPAERSVAKQG